MCVCVCVYGVMGWGGILLYNYCMYVCSIPTDNQSCQRAHNISENTTAFLSYVDGLSSWLA